MYSGCSLSSGSAGQVGRGAVHQLVPPVVAAGRPGDGRAGPAVDDHVLERGAQRRGAVGVLLERDQLAAAIAAVGGHQHLGLAVLDPARERLGTEAAEDHRVRRADPAQARSAITSSGTSGMYTATTSPGPTPSPLSTLANFETSRWRS